MKVSEAKVAAKRRYYERNREECIERSRRWRENNRERYNEHMKTHKEKHSPEFLKRRARGYALMRDFGITLEQYDELLEKQNGCCAICQRHHALFEKHLSVDHSHKTKRIRGLLCTHCNYRLVARHEDGELLRRIADYVEQSTDWVVPDRPRKKRKWRAKT
jgi:hypothetical protein